jgi:hypothetical protein
MGDPGEKTYRAGFPLQFRYNWNFRYNPYRRFFNIESLNYDSWDFSDSNFTTFKIL